LSMVTSAKIEVSIITEKVYVHLEKVVGRPMQKLS